MSVLTKVAVGGATATALTVLGITMAGVVTTTAVVAIDPLAPAAHADGLSAFDDCAALRSWYVERGVAAVGPYGWGGGVVAYAEDSGTTARSGVAGGVVPLADQAQERTSSTTGTNTQEAAVDEPDVAKTDGTRVVRMTAAGDLVVTDVSGPRPREIGRVPVPGAAGYGDELLLVGDRALVIGHDFAPVPLPGPGPTDLIAPRSSRVIAPRGTRVVTVDLSSPTAPRIAHVDRYDGRLVSARTYGSVVRLVTADPRPELAWVYPQEPANGTGRRITEAQATAHNRALVRATALEDWLPSLHTETGRTPLVGCDEVLHPAHEGDPGTVPDTITVTTFPADDLEQRSSVAVTAAGQIVYSSADRLYVAANRWEYPVRRAPVPDGPVSSLPEQPGREFTDLHAFALDGLQTRYVASGTIRGTVRDRWSLDEHDGVLRAAWTRQGDAGTANGISTLRERDGRLTTIAELGDLGIDETIQSVRWLDDLAVLVTFRQVDPLYTVDLTDPARPRALGELKIPGYSGYLHPIGENRLLGLGVAADLEGRVQGSQAAVFDIASPTDPARVGMVDLGRATGLTALEDPRAFTWLPDRKTGLTTTQSWSTGRSRLVTLSVAGDGALSSRDLGEVSDGWQTRVLPLDDGRVAVVDNDVKVLSIPAGRA